jgi:two-component system cell cycle sensor histidine kinase/response regulator CckA
VAVLVIAIAGLTYRYHLDQKESIKAEVRNSLLAISDAKVRQITDWRRERMGDARLIMADAMELAAMRRFIAGSGASDRAEIEAWLGAFNDAMSYAGACITDARGRVVLTMGRRFGGDEALRKAALEAIGRGEPILTSFHRDDPSGPIHLGLNVPLRISPAPAFGAVLLLIDPSSHFYPMLLTWPTPSRTAEALLVQREGNSALYLNELRLRSNAALNLRIPLSDSGVPAVQAVDGKEGAVEGPDYRGVPVFAAVRRVPNSPWYLVAKVDADEVLAPIARRSAVVGALGVSLILAAAAGLMMLWRRQQTQQLLKQYKAEVEHRALVGHYQYLSRFANDIILLLDETGRIVEINDRAVERYGWSREQLLRMNIRDLHDPSEIEGLKTQWDENGRSQSAVFETVHHRRDGTAFPVEISSRVMPAGDRVFRQSIIRDITERKAMDEKLRGALATLAQSEADFRAAFEQAAVGMAHLSLEGRFLRVNARFCQILGYTREEMLEMSYGRLLPADEANRAKEFLRSFLRGDLDSVFQERRCLRKDGSEVWLNSTTSVMRSPAGDPTHLMTVVEDVTERRRDQVALAQGERRFRQVVENAPDGIVVSDGAHITLYMNPAGSRLLGAGAPGELVGKSWLDSIHPEERESARRRGSLVAGGVPAGTVERRLLRLNGEALPVEISGVPIQYDGRPAAMTFFHDITERKRTEAERAALEAQLRQAQKLESIGRLAGGVAHDFNNHLTVINGYGAMLQEQFPADHPAREALDEIVAAGNRAAALTQQLLAFSRKQVTQPRPIKLNEVVEDAAKMLRRLIGEDVEIAISLDPAPATIMADRGQINQVLMNLAVNARDAMPNGGRLAIETATANVNAAHAALHAGARPGRFAVLSVSDSGTGMSPDTLQKIFEPFFTTKRTGEGTGLGLAIVYGIVRGHGGWIGVYSELGKGTSFHIYIPQADVAAETAADAAPAVSELRGSETLLVVEDQPEVLHLAMAVLRDKGYRVIEASTAEQALALAAGYSAGIDLLLTDVVMPGMNGPELARRILEIRPSLRILYMSGYAATAMGRAGVLEPAAAFLPKPFTALQLSMKIREVLAKP